MGVSGCAWFGLLRCMWRTAVANRCDRRRVNSVVPGERLRTGNGRMPHDFSRQVDNPAPDTAATAHDRRTFLQTSLAISGGLLAGPAARAADPAGSTASKRAKIPVAGVVTEYRRNSHADVILGKILEGYNQDGGPGPDLRLVSLYVDQFPKGDMSRQLAKKFNVRLCDTIDEAITLGGQKVAVSGVFSIGEHGTYPLVAETRQRKYPRKRFFDQIVKALQRGGRVVPVFSDKHLSYRTDEALAMYRTARQLKIPFMAGSSLPVAWRTPPIDVPIGAQMKTALAIGYGGFESYGFHALETLQCMVERRRGGEVGVKSVRAVQGPAVLEARDQGYWSDRLLLAALGRQSKKLPANWQEQLQSKSCAFYLIDYVDGFRACVAMLNGLVSTFVFACDVAGQPDPLSTEFTLQDGPPFRHFEWLVRAIDPMMHSGKPSYPVERTVLTTGILDAIMHSLADGGKRMATPQLKIGYRPADWPAAPGSPPPTRPW